MFKKNVLHKTCTHNSNPISINLLHLSFYVLCALSKHTNTYGSQAPPENPKMQNKQHVAIIKKICLFFCVLCLTLKCKIYAIN